MTDVASDGRTTRWVDGVLWLVTAACALATVWFSFGASPPGTELFPGADKVGHAIAYFATSLSFLLVAVWRPGRGEGRFPVWGRLLPILAVGAGIVIEILQSLTASRDGEVLDVVAEVVGVVAALAVHAGLRRHDRAGLASS